MYRTAASTKAKRADLVSNTIFKMLCRSVFIYFGIVGSEISKIRVEKGSAAKKLPRVGIDLSSLFRLLLTRVKTFKNIKLNCLQASSLWEWLRP